VADSDADAVTVCAQRYGVQVELREALPVIAHGFTHYHLDILPQPAQVSSWPRRAAEPGLIWLSVEEAKAAAIPTPVRGILEQLIGRSRRR
jgi:A/G-specific adenine glycosylase